MSKNQQRYSEFLDAWVESRTREEPFQMRFPQRISVRCTDPDALLALLAERDDPGSSIILADFAEVDGDVTTSDEDSNNQREATERWATKLREVVDGEPEWIHHDELYRIGIIDNLQTR
jgi:hypothetical protein